MIHPSGVFHFRLQHLDVHSAPGPMATQVRSIVKTPTRGSVKAPPSVTLTPCKLCKIQHTDVGSAWLRPITPSSLGPAQHLRRGSSRKTRRVIPVTLPVYITRNTASRLFHALRVVPPTRERLVHYLLHDSPVNGDGSYREEQLIPKPTTGGFCRSWTL